MLQAGFNTVARGGTFIHATGIAEEECTFFLSLLLVAWNRVNTFRKVMFSRWEVAFKLLHRNYRWEYIVFYWVLVKNRGRKIPVP